MERWVKKGWKWKIEQLERGEIRNARSLSWPFFFLSFKSVHIPRVEVELSYTIPFIGTVEWSGAKPAWKVGVIGPF